MFSLDINRPLIIFGEIYEAEKFVYQNPEVLQNLSACIFDDTVNEYFHGVKILDINSKVAREKLATICIAVTTACSNGYLEKKTFLESLGRNEFEDFFWAKALNKSIVVINANCHGKALAEYLDQSRHFRNSYLIYPLQQIQENVTGDISENVLKVTDIYIHQDIREANSISKKLSDSEVRKRLGRNVTDITIPNLVGMGNWMYPQLGDLDKFIRKKDETVYVFYRDEILDSVAECKSLSEYVNYWNSYIYDSVKLNDIWEMNRKKLEMREKNWDVKIFDYIYKNYKSIPCFVDSNHPSKYLMKEIGRQVSNILGLNDICDDLYKSEMGLPIPVLPVVKKHFELEFKVEIERRTEYLGRVVEGSELENYIRAYMWWYHNKCF